MFGERAELVFAVISAALWVIGFVLELTTGIDGRVLTGIFIAAGLFGGFFTLREAIDSVRNGRFEIDFLMIVAAAGAAALGKWEEGALLLALFSVGHALEGYAMGRARRAIEALAELAPATALVRRAGREVEVRVEELVIGDVVLVKPNERIPADGFVLAGTSSVNQAPLTGESIPVDKAPVSDSAAAAADPERVPAEFPAVLRDDQRQRPAGPAGDPALGGIHRGQAGHNGSGGGDPGVTDPAVHRPL